MSANDKINEKANESVNEKTYDKGMIRPLGIVVFAVVTGLLLLCFYWVAPWLIKQSIEHVGTEINGAKVEVAEVDLSLSPAGVYVYGLQVTDAKQPMENMFELTQAYAELDLFELWGGKVIVDDLNIEALRFGTQRTSSGALNNDDKKSEDGVEKQSASDVVNEKIGKLGAELPDANDLLNRHPLRTTKLASELDATFEAQKEKWAEVSNALPDEERLKYFEREFKALTEGDIKSLDEFNARKKKFDALKKELEQEKAQLLGAKEQLSKSKQLVQQAYQDLKNAPQQDWNELKQQYSFDSAGGLNLSGLLFGSEFQSYAEDALYWYERLAPLMASGGDDSANAKSQEAIEPPRGSGRFVYFNDENPSPAFLIRKARANAVLSQGEVAFLGQDITNQQYVTGKPSVITAEASELNDTDKIDMRLVIDHRSVDTVDSFSLLLKGQNLNDLALSKSESMPLALTDAKLDATSDIELRGEQLSGAFKSRFNNTKLISEGTSSIAKEISEVVKGVQGFAVDAAIDGTLASPGFDISSDLDRILKDAVMGRFKAKQKEWESKIKAGLDEKLQAYLAENESVGSYFSDQGSLVESDLNSVDSLLEKKLDSFVDAQKKEAQDKVSNKLKDKLKGLF